MTLAFWPHGYGAAKPEQAVESAVIHKNRLLVDGRAVRNRVAGFIACAGTDHALTAIRAVEW